MIYNRKLAAQKSRLIQINHLENGRWPFGIMLGYHKVYSHCETVLLNDKTLGRRLRKVHKYKLEVDPKTAPILLDIFTSYCSNNYSLETLSEYICKKYNISLTSRSNLEKILINKFYIGEMHAFGKIYYHSYERIISDELFEKTQQLKNSRKGSGVKYIHLNTYMYVRLIYCKKCITRVFTPEKKGKKGYYCVLYSCYGHKPRKYCNEKLLSILFLKSFDKITLNYDYFLSVSKNLKDKIYYVLDNYQKLFVSNVSIRRNIINFFFKDIFFDGEELFFTIRAPFNNENYQEFSTEELDNLIYLLDPTKIDECTITVEEESSLHDKILILCKNPHSTNELIEELEISLMELQDNLLDLQLRGKINQDSFGYWNIK
jgi:hypothetical protein